MPKDIWFPDDLLSCHTHSEIPTRNPELPRFSVVMPSFNQAKFIERSILSVLNQDYPNVQLIVIDGGSTDGTVDIIKKYSSHINYWISEKDSGQSDALNKGFAKADGEIFGWLNSDDLYLPGSLKKVAEAFAKNPKSGIVVGDWILIDELDKIIRSDYAFDFSLNQLIHEGWHTHPQATFWKRSVHERFGKFDTDLHTNMDFQMILCMGRNEGNHSFARISECLGAWRQHEEQKTGHLPGVSIHETRLLEKRYGIQNRSSLSGKTLRLLYRFRRAYWILKRGGFFIFLQRLRQQI